MSSLALDGFPQGAVGGAETSFDFRIITDGTRVTAFNKNGVAVYSGLDGGAALTTCLPAANSGGASIEFRNDGSVFPWSTVPRLPAGITGRLVIQGNGSTIRLSSGGNAFLYVTQLADYATFQNIQVDNFVVDCNNIASARGAVLDIQGQRINVDQFMATRLKGINIPVGGGRWGIRFISNHLGASETQTNLTNITIRDCSLAGGDFGFNVQGEGASTVQVFIDNVLMEDCTHDTGTVPLAQSGQANFQIGSFGFGGACTLRRCKGSNSADVGVEVDGMLTAIVDDCEMTDAFVANYFARNFNAPTDTRGQTATFEDCRSRVVNLDGSQTTMTGYRQSAAGATTFGKVTILNCKHITAQTTITGNGYVLDCSGTLNALTVENFDMIMDAVNDATSATTFVPAFQIAPTTDMRLCLKNLYIRQSGTVGTGIRNRIVRVGTNGGKEIDLLIDGISFDNNLAGTTNGTTRCLELAENAYAMTCRGTIRRVDVAAFTGSDTQPTGVYVFGTSFLTLNVPLNITQCDFSKFPVGCTEITYDTSGASNAVNVRVFSNSYKNKPAPVAFTGLVTATGKALATGWSAMCTFTQGSGTADTAIDYSTNGGTTYTNFLTQASGALPAGFDESLGPLTSDSLIKVTFTGTQPTITLVPVNP